jgi:hypothetical protein
MGPWWVLVHCDHVMFKPNSSRLQLTTCHPKRTSANAGGWVGEVNKCAPIWSLDFVGCWSFESWRCWVGLVPAAEATNFYLVCGIPARARARAHRQFNPQILTVREGGEGGSSNTPVTSPFSIHLKHVNSHLDQLLSYKSNAHVWNWREPCVRHAWSETPKTQRFTSVPQWQMVAGFLETAHAY